MKIRSLQKKYFDKVYYMNKLIVVDDEYMIRKTIQNCIINSDLNFEVVGCFSNGITASEFLLNNSVDVIITDIRMPGMSGLDLIKKFYQIKPDSKFIILSGYSEFDYARLAIDYGIVKYLVKPVDMVELLEVLKKVERTLEKERKNNYFTSNFIFEEEFFSALVKGVFIDSSYMKSCISQMQLPFDINKAKGKIYKLKIINFESYISKNWKYGKENILHAFSNVFEKLMYFDKAYSVLNDDDTISVICFELEEKNFSEQEIMSLFLQTLEVHVAIIEEISFDYFFDLPEIINSNINMNDKVKLITSYIMDKKPQEAISILSNSQYSHELMEKIISNFKKLGIDINRPENEDDYDKFVQNLIIQVGINQDSKINNIMKRVNQYIEDNYSKEITRIDIAAHVFLDPSYFGKLFKKKTGTSISNYLLEFRINKAKILLENEDISILKVCNLVGYSNLTFFTRKFKQYTSYTPNEYRKKVRKNEKDNTKFQ